MKDYDIPSSFLSQEEEAVTIIHPIIDDLIFDQAGNIQVDNISYFTEVLIYRYT